jgi:hypothetical protein
LFTSSRSITNKCVKSFEVVVNTGLTVPDRMSPSY